MKQRLDTEIVQRGLATSRSQADNYIRLGKVLVDGATARKSGQMVDSDVKISLELNELYVSRAGLKLASVAQYFDLGFADKIVLDVGSSTGGFTDYALKHGAKKVIAVDVGTDQLHPSLRGDDRIELYEKTDIRQVTITPTKSIENPTVISQTPDLIVCDVSFISLREILPHVAQHLMGPQTKLIAMVKPQFEAGRSQVNKGVIKNDKIRRQILSDFEVWSKQYFAIWQKRDSEVAGAKGNLERFYLLAKLPAKR